MMLEQMVNDAKYFQVNNAVPCRRCGQLIFWQRSRRTQKMYPTDVIPNPWQSGYLTQRANFHHCKPEDIDALKAQAAAQAGQQTLPGMGMDLTRIWDLLKKAQAAGLKYPQLRLRTKNNQDVCIKMAGQLSKYHGSLLITDGQPFHCNKFFGTVNATGQFIPYTGRRIQFVTQTLEDVKELLYNLAKDPVAVVSAYGKLTGNCCFCFRALDDPRSTVVGYGPVCAQHYGLPWG